jgi:hypothetical protein
MTIRKIFRTAVIGMAASLIAAQGHAAISVSDATVQNATAGLTNASATVMGQGKIKNAKVNEFTGLFAGNEWSKLDRTNQSSKTFEGVNFVLAADTGQNSGEWFLDWSGAAVPEYMDYVLVLKSGKQWGAFLFESVNPSLDLQDLGGTFQISWLNQKGKYGKLRHASIFGRVGDAPVIDPPDGPDDPNDPNGVPIPGSLALLVMGLGLMLMRLRQMEPHTAPIPRRPV